MSEIFMINLLGIKSKNMMKLEKLQHGKEITQQDVCQTINTLKIIIN